MIVKTRKMQILLIFSLLLVFVVSTFNIGKVFAGSDIFTLIDASINSKSDGAEASIVSFDTKNIVANTTYHKLNDYVEYKLTIKNNSDKTYSLKGISDDNDSSYVVYEYQRNVDEKITPGSKKEILVKAIYKNELTDISNRDFDSDFKFEFDFFDEEGNKITTNIGVNPKTGDNMLIYVALALSSLIGLIYFALKLKKSKIILPMLILFTPVMVKAMETTFSIRFDNELKIYDKLQVSINSGTSNNNDENITGYGSKIERPDDPEKDGYEFKGWYVKDEEFDFDSEVTEDTQIEAKFDIIQYTINYNLNGGEAENPREYNVETESFDLVNPTKQGYNFAGWTGSNGNTYQTRVTVDKGSTGNKTFNANFIARDDTPYQVIHKYKNLDGTYEEETEDLTGVTDTTISPSTRNRYGFISPSLQTVQLSANGLTKVEYVYERLNYTITYEELDYIETEFTNESYPYGTEISLVVKDKPGYTFDYLKINNDNLSDRDMTFTLIENTTIKPYFTANQYRINFIGNNEQVAGSCYQSATYGQTFALSDTCFYPSNYIFNGWNTEADGSGTGYTAGQRVSNLTTEESINLYAQWTPKTYTITFDAQGGTEVDNVDRNYNTLIGVPTSTMEGYDLEGWYQCPNGYCSKLTDETVATQSETYYANWKLKKLHVTFDTMGGSALEEYPNEPYGYEINYNSQIYSLPFRTYKEGYAFDGWYTDTNYTNKVENDYIVTEDVTLYAKWIYNISYADISEELEIESDGTATITVDYGNKLGEDYTFMQGNTDIATVDENGVVSAVSAGETYLYVRGLKSNEWIPVKVKVLPKVFTITFDAQGGEEVESVQRTEGETSLNLPSSTKDYYEFGGWYTDTTYETRVGYDYPLNDNITVYAKWNKTECTDFEIDSWDTIYQNITTSHTDKYPLGCTKDVTLGNDLGTFKVRILNNTRPEICETEGLSQTACGYVIEFSEVITKHKAVTTSTTTGGWPASEIRRYMNNEIYNALPNDLKSKIIDTYVVSGYGPDDSSVFESIDKLYALNVSELYASSEQQPFTFSDAMYEVVASQNRTRKIDYYYNVNFINNERKTTHYCPEDGMGADYFTRTPSKENDILWISSSYFGGISTTNIDGVSGVSPVFRIWDGVTN